jgi:alkaline phosphatase D
MKADFQNEPLGDMIAIGAVEPHRVRLWMRADRPGLLTVRWWKEGEEDRSGKAVVEIPEGNERDNTCSILIPPASGGPSPLDPNCRYRYRVTDAAGGRILGEGAFETAPDVPCTSPSRYSIAFMSCHQPFTERGTVSRKSIQMLKAAGRCMKQHKTRLVFMIGDQMYSDFPNSLSLFERDYFRAVAPPGRLEIRDCSPEEVRRLYQRRYRHFWNIREWRAIHEEYPCYLILDDHDILDNWGSNPAHQLPQWRSVAQGAKLAYFDYQGSRVLPVEGEMPEDFHFSLAFGHCGFFVMDLRSERKAGENGRLYSGQQEDALKEFLRRSGDRKILFFVFSVPVVHLPKRLARFAARLPPKDEDFSDRWSTGAHLRDRDRFLKILHRHQVRHPQQRHILLSGDIHIGCVHRIRWTGGGEFYQVISSGITHSPGTLIQIASALSIRLNRSISTMDGSVSASVRLLKGVRRHRRNPFPGLNLGIIEIAERSLDPSPGIQFHLYGHRGEAPLCAYRSPVI